MGVDLSTVDLSNIDSTILYLRSFGLYGPLAAFVLFVIQAAFPFFPYIILAGAVGVIFDPGLGIFLAWSGALLGSVIVYGSSRLAGSNIFIRLVEKHYDIDLKALNELNQSKIFFILLISRIFPVVPTPLINVGAAVTGVPFKIFFISSAIGKIPWAVSYVLLGDYLIKSHDFSGVLIVLGVVIIFSLFGLYLFRDYFAIFGRKKTDATNSGE